MVFASGLARWEGGVLARSRCIVALGRMARNVPRRILPRRPSSSTIAPHCRHQRRWHGQRACLTFFAFVTPIVLAPWVVVVVVAVVVVAVAWLAR